MSGHWAIVNARVGIWVDGPAPWRPKDQTCLCDFIGCDCCETGKHVGSYDCTPDAFGIPRHVDQDTYALFAGDNQEYVHRWELGEDETRYCDKCKIPWIECRRPCGPFRGEVITCKPI